MTTAITVTVLLAFVVSWLALELLFHRRNLNKIPIRIHVNGTRGKSSVTRLLAAGLSASGSRVVAKTTGTLARVIVPGKQELAVYRPLGANIREQVRIARFAAEQQAQILVLECMALQPFLQWLSEKVFVRATHGVITNARPDHLDVMGPSGDDVARALAGMMPRGQVCFTCEEERLAILETAARDRATKLIAISSEQTSAVEAAELAGFSYFEHAENVALSLAVCECLGVSRDAALRAMWSGTPDPGALSFYELDFFGRRLVFVNGFAANDPVSSAQIWELCIARFPSFRRICVVNCRADRPDRSRQLGQAIGHWSRPDRVVLVGRGTGFFAKAALRSDLVPEQLVSAEGLDARDTFERLIDDLPDQALLVGLGNIGGLGLELVRMFRNRSRPLLPSDVEKT